MARIQLFVTYESFSSDTPTALVNRGAGDGKETCKECQVLNLNLKRRVFKRFQIAYD